ncbi:hypothetical protein [Leptospira wolffii]|uniref:hypothetical protein n=1 Tax=Leptospira wolffii TaxID=409998 RepID=UPI0002EA1C3B|nr:hypothetical protein [Leptospira wolffii]EPG67089.1 putative lipoprotein [Leptospira wolffii serovar Khorat str. Khorat-H2]
MLNYSKITRILLFSLVLFLSACNKGGKDDSTGLILAYLFYEPPVADIVFDKGFPGSNNVVAGFDFPGVSGDYTVTINGTSATGISLPDSTSLQFTMPSLSGITGNTTVPMIIQKQGVDYIFKTVRYRPLLSITLGQPNAYYERISAGDNSVFFQFTAGTHTVSSQLGNVQTDFPAAGANDDSGNHIINAFGYNGANLNLSYLTSANASDTFAAAGGTSFVFKKVTLTSGNTYIVRVRHVGGIITYFKMNISNGQITASGTDNHVTDPAWILCYDFQGRGSVASGNGCAIQNASNPSGARVGRCTYPSEGGLTTRNYYAFGYSTYYAAQTCYVPGFGSYNHADAIFEDN